MTDTELEYLLVRNPESLDIERLVAEVRRLREAIALARHYLEDSDLMQAVNMGFATLRAALDVSPDCSETKSKDTYARLIILLQEHVGETGVSEGAVDVLRRLIRDHEESGCPRRHLRLEPRP